MNREEKEFSLLPKDSIVLEFQDEILALVAKFSQSGQSGGSAPYYAKAISQCVEKLCMQKPISPITGEESEWVEWRDGEYQNIRDSRIFKNGNNRKLHTLEAIIWRNQNGDCYYGTANTKDGEKIKSRQYIKELPFTPKTFYIDITETEVKPGDFIFTINNEDDLKEVFEYYDKY